MKPVVYTALSILVTAAVFANLFRSVSLGEVMDVIENADRFALIAFVTLSLCMSIFRTMRYQLLLPGERVNPTALFLVVLVRNFFSDLLPARIGSSMYLLLLNKRLGVPFAPTVSSFSVAFIFDLLAIAPLILIALAVAGLSLPVSPILLIALSLILAAGSMTALKILPAICKLAASRLVDGEPQSKRRKFESFLIKLAEQIEETTHAGLAFKLLLLSLFVRLTKYGGLYVFLYALLAPLGYSWGELPFPKIFLGMCAAELAASLPISGIAGFGLYEGTWAAVFEILGYPESVAKLTAISHHLFTQVYGYMLGCGALLILLVWKPKKREQTTLASPDGFYKKFATALTMTCVICLGALSFSRSSVTEAEPAPEKPNEENQRIASDLARDFPGRIVFDSRRNGTFGIYSIHVDGTAEETLIDSPLHEMYPDASPDGKSIVYSVTHSTMREEPGEVWIYSVPDRSTRLLAKNGSFPTFSANGKSVYFEREQNKLMMLDLESNKSKILLPRVSPSFKGYKIRLPRISPDGRFAAFTSDRKGRWNGWYVDLTNGEYEHIAHGCEPSWFPDSKNLVWIKKQNARERSGIFRFEPDSRTIKTVQDADAPWGHEYFPTITPDGKYLLYAAAPPGEHDHASSHYQLHVRELSSDRVVRVTFDNHNSRWPKLLPAIADQKNQP